MLAKLGMKREGLLRQRVRKLEVFEDVVQTVTGYRSPITDHQRADQAVARLMDRPPAPPRPATLNLRPDFQCSQTASNTV